MRTPSATPVALCIGLLFAVCISEAQNLDSLYAVWTNPDEVATNRLEAAESILGANSGKLMFEHMDSARTIAEQQLALATEVNDTLYMVMATGTLANLEMFIDENTKAFELIRDARELAMQSGNPDAIMYSKLGYGVYYYYQGDYETSYAYLREGIELAQKVGNREKEAEFYAFLGMILHWANNYEKALEMNQNAADTYYELGLKDKYLEMLLLVSRAYYFLEEYTSAREVLYKSKDLLTGRPDSLDKLRSIYRQLGWNYSEERNYDMAIENALRELEVEDILGQPSKASHQYLADYYLKNGDKEDAREQLDLIDSMNQPSHGVNFMHHAILSGIAYAELSDIPKAISLCSQAERMASETNNLRHLRGSCECLYKAYEKAGDKARAFDFLNRYVEYNDSITENKKSKEILSMEFERNILQDSIQREEQARQIELAHQEELRKKKQTQNMTLTGGFIALLLAGGFFSRWQYVNRAKAIIEKEKNRSESLLLNILPAEVAEELKLNGKAEAQEFDKVSILFTDFAEFTKASEDLSATDLVEELNICFKNFDTLVDKYKIEKIKTIGDAYMAAGGLPMITPDSVKNTVLCALDMQAFIKARKSERVAKGLTAFDMRVGIHTGHIVAGIVGVKKFQYDIWGDTVNTASRMESAGSIGMVNVSQAVYDILQDDPDLTFMSRGKIQVKGKGEIEMYFVKRANKSEAI